MSTMRTNKWIGIATLSAVAVYGVSACGEEPGDATQPVTTTTGPASGTPTTPVGPGTTPGPGTAPPGPGTSGTVSPAIPPTPPGSTTPMGGGGMPPAPAGAFPVCTSVTYENANMDNTMAMLDGVESTFFFGDNTTTACSDFTMAGRVCMYGTAVPSGDDYSAWGAGMGLHLATTDGGGNVVAPFDAESLGIAGFRVTLSNVMGRPVRLQISQVDDPAITESNANYQANGFVQGGSAPMAVSADGEVEAMFTEFALPEWTELMGGVEGQMVDPSQIHALQFQIANNPPDPTVPYSVCISGLTWLDAAGGVVDAPDPEPMAGGGMGGMPGGGMGGTPMGGSPGGGMGGSPGGGMGGTPMGGMPGGGMGGGGGDAPSFAADIHPIFTENCTPCHDTGTMSAGRTHGQADVNAAYMSATMMPEVIVEMVTSGQMPLGGMLTQEEIDLIVAWVDGGTPE